MREEWHGGEHLEEGSNLNVSSTSKARERANCRPVELSNWASDGGMRCFGAGRGRLHNTVLVDRRHNAIVFQRPLETDRLQASLCRATLSETLPLPAPIRCSFPFPHSLETYRLPGPL
jgi:hypothetical protein